MINLTLISLFVIILFYTAGVIVNLTYRVAFGSPVKDVLSGKMNHVVFGTSGVILFLLFATTGIVKNKTESYIESFLMSLPNTIAALVFMIVAYILGFLLTQGIRKAISSNSLTFHLLVAIIATLPLLFFVKFIIRVLT